MTYSNILRYVVSCLIIMSYVIIAGCSKSSTVMPTTTQFPCAPDRECIDVCKATLLVMQQGECRTGCAIYKDKLVGYYELKYALETCEVMPNSSQK